MMRYYNCYYYSIPRLNYNLTNWTLTKAIHWTNKAVETRGQIVEGQPLCWTIAYNDERTASKRAKQEKKLESKKKKTIHQIQTFSCNIYFFSKNFLLWHLNMCGENTEKIKQNLSKEKKKVTQYPNVLSMVSRSCARIRWRN